MTYSVKQAGKAAGIAATTVRAWGKELADVLSDQATPPAGRERRFTDDDIAILHTAKILRAEGQEWSDIVEAISQGDRIEPVQDAPPFDEAGEGEPPSAGALVSAEWWDRMTQPFKDHVATLEAQLDKTEAELDEERAARLDAEKRATAAETEARMLREQVDEESGRGKEKGLLDRLLGRS